MEEAARLDAATAALISLTEAGIPTDVHELLIVGDPSRGIAPGSLSKAIATVLRSLSSPDHADAGKVEVDGWLPIETAPKDGTHILAILYRDACSDMDDIHRASFSEVREIWYKPYHQFGKHLPWHAGDPFDAHDGMASDHFGEAVPIHWRPLPTPPSSEVA
ncbi:hypothetical protein HED55_08195 [Ochrobactrum haematophilum]|uniref:DUF551 domain-containing protein n=1 Tax=Brucella haematophila TaxID=419474 RepID=A0ABX1DLU1_9HYPH|nr:hypothetical protein [Brucella haematophila]